MGGLLQRWHLLSSMASLAALACDTSRKEYLFDIIHPVAGACQY